MTSTVLSPAIQGPTTGGLQPPTAPVDSPALRRFGSHSFGDEGLPDVIVTTALDILRLVQSRVHKNQLVDGTRTAHRSQQHLRDATGVTAFISTTWAETVRVMAKSVDPVGLIPVLDRLRQLESMVTSHLQAQSARLRETAIDGLTALSRCSTGYELAAAIPRNVARLGFDRVIFSTVSSSGWQPVSAYSVPGDPAPITELVENLPTSTWFYLPPAAADRRYAQVRAQKMLAHRDPAGGYALWSCSQARDFWMFPVINRRSITGLVHVDCLVQNRLPSRTQVEALNQFCRQLPLVLARHDSSTETVQRFPDDGGSFRDHHLKTCQPTAPKLSPLAETTSDSLVPLSERESEVLRLMAAGLTNAQIGRRLSITEGTVKSHVKRVLRKTGASNRAEAVATRLSTSQAG